MATLSQIQANRRNSQKSTGPRTGAGKAASSRNALKTGLYAESMVVTGEDPGEFTALLDSYRQSLRPITPVQIALVDQLVHADWLLRRMRNLETQLWDESIYDREKWMGNDYDESIRFAEAYPAIQEQLVLVQRRVSALERTFHRALHDLRRLQSSEPQPDAARPTPSTACDALNAAPWPPAANPIGFVSPSSPHALARSTGRPQNPAPNPHSQKLASFPHPAPRARTVHQSAPTPAIPRSPAPDRETRP